MLSCQDLLVIGRKAIFFLLGLGIVSQFLFGIKKIFISKIKLVITGFLFFTIGVFVHSVHQNKDQVSINSSNRIITEFELDEIYKTTDKYRKYKVKAVTANGKRLNLLLYYSKDLPKLNYESTYQSELKIFPVSLPLNDYGFDFQKFLKRKGIAYQSYLYSTPIKSDKIKRNIHSFFQERRNHILDRINNSSLSLSTKMFLKSIVLADKTEMDASIYEDFKRSGMSHVLAISGMHIAIIFGFVYFLLSMIIKNRKWIITGSLLLIWFFGFFIGIGNSVFRACLMLTIYYIFYFLQRKQDFVHTWSLSLLIILFLNTQQLFDVGFQLSFTAVMGIYWLYKPILSLFPKLPIRWTNFIFQIISVTLSAQISVLPLLLYYFHTFSVIGVFTNLILIPFIQIIVIISFVMVFLLYFSNLFSFLIEGYDLIVQYLLKVIHYFSKFNYGNIDNVPFYFLEVVFLFYLIYQFRFLLKDFNIKKIIHYSFLILLFIGLNLGLTVYQNSQSEIKVHKTFNGKIISSKKGKVVTFYIQTDNNHTAVNRYIITPYLLSKRTSKYKVVYLSKDCKSISFEGVNYKF